VIERIRRVRRSRITALLAAAFIVCGCIAPASAQSAPVSATPSAAQSQPSQGGGVTGEPATYVGDETCKACHQAQAHEFSQTTMGKIMLAHPRDENESRGCESCHGPGSRYVAEMAEVMGKGIKPDQAAHGPAVAGVMTFRKDSDESAEQDNAVCLTCHDKGEQSFWRASIHSSRGLRCVDCHTIMRQVSPRFQLSVAMESSPFITTRPETQVCLRCHLTQKMEINLPSHMPVREGAMACTDCHNPHGGPYPDQLVRATVTETCYTCHAEKRGPFLWMHPPVMQNCLNCHQPHGSINRFMLTMRPPRLCQQCHIGTYHPGTPAKANTLFVFSRACLNCHSAIHGSNAPGGMDLTR
jgi:DmsE family decaheme c-type cytochrome